MTTLANKEGQYYISKLEAVAISNLNATRTPQVHTLLGWKVSGQSGAGLHQATIPLSYSIFDTVSASRNSNSWFVMNDMTSNRESSFRLLKRNILITYLM